MKAEKQMGRKLKVSGFPAYVYCHVFHINEHVVKHEVTLLLKPVLLNVTKKKGASL